MRMVDLYPELFEDIINEVITEQQFTSPDESLIGSLLSYCQSIQTITIGRRQITISMN